MIVYQYKISTSKICNFVIQTKNHQRIPLDQPFNDYSKM
jgi:hypothetical protein